MNSARVQSRVQNKTVRLIPYANHKPPVLEALVSSFGARLRLEQLESVTSGRLNPKRRSGAGGTARYGSTYVNAAFAYPRHAGNRFSPKEWGAWYCAFEVETSLQEVSFHLTRALTASGVCYDNITHYIELIADVDDDFVDLRALEPVPDCLAPDDEIGYVAGQALGDEIRREGLNGVVYPSVRHPGGTCLVAFWPHLVLNFRQGGIWEMVWAGSPAPTIRQVS